MAIDVNNAQRAQILVEALPYIKRYYKKTVVIKFGGNAMISDELKTAVMGDIALLSLIGVQIVMVHGGGPEITRMLARIGKVSQFVNGLRVTDEETAEVVQMVLAGKINKGLVTSLFNMGGRAIGLSGMDGRMIEAEMMDERLGYVGQIVKVRPQPILDLLEKGYIPVVSTLGVGQDGHVYNINADTAAAYIAGSLRAESLITMTDTVGVLHDPNDASTLIPVLTPSDVDKLKEEGVISGGMIPKIDCCLTALDRGVKKVFIIDGRVPHAILIETLTDEGIGTMFVKES
jgi:acetylglutamate kinase